MIVTKCFAGFWKVATAQGEFHIHLREFQAGHAGERKRVRVFEIFNAKTFEQVARAYSFKEAQRRLSERLAQAEVAAAVFGR